MMRRDLLGLLSAATLLCAPLSAGAADADAKPGAAKTAMPKVRNISYYYDGFEQGLARPVSRAFDPVVLVHRISGKRRECANVDASDQVLLPSTWWQPRLGFRPVSVAQMLDRGGIGGGPAPGKLLVTKLKTQGVSTGFQVKDANGTKFAIKFDPPGYAELASGADVAVSYLYWAAGYNVPANTIVDIRHGDLEIAPNATFQDETGRKHPLTMAMVDGVLGKVRTSPDGSYRAVASRFFPGTPLGEWLYKGRRRDDPEDLVPHEYRREVRGLYLIYAWTNNTDCSARNTFDSWVTEGGRSFVRHYLIDFSGALGSASIGPMTPRDGSEYLMDYGTAGTSLVTLGLLPPKWESAASPNLEGVGFFESQVFDPEHWRPFLPNPAFDEITERDLAWGARVVAAFSDEQIRAAIQQGRYTDPHTVDYLTRTLSERRDKIARRWLKGPASIAAARGQ